jgi:hypothetical protein
MTSFSLSNHSWFSCADVSWPYSFLRPASDCAGALEKKPVKLYAWCMATSSFRPLARIASACSFSRSSFGPLATEFHSLTRLFHIEKPSWCSATGPANLAPASAKSWAHSSGSKLPPADLSLGANCLTLPALSRAPLMKSWYGQAAGSPYTDTWLVLAR